MENHKALIVKMYKKGIQIKVFLWKMHKFSKNLKNFQKVLDKSKLMCYNKDNKDTEKETLKN